MTLPEIKKEIAKYQYFEDTDVIDIALASIIATRLKLGDPVWLVIIGASSGGKSQILRPLSLTDSKFLHRIDDLTENTFLSGGKVGKGKEPSLLNRIGTLGMIVMSDLTVLFSKNKETRGTILSQFRMIYDGEMTKFVGTSEKPLTWKGHLGVLAGSTPSIYAHFEEVSDMGERFIYYRMKDFDREKATRLALVRRSYGKDLDQKLSELYAEYIREIVTAQDGEVILPESVQERIIRVAMFAEKVRTTAHIDFYRNIDRIPVSAMPMRVALQLSTIAKGLTVMRGGTLSEDDLRMIDWCGYSLANEEKRGCLRILGSVSFETSINTSSIADLIGLPTEVVGNILQNLSSIDVLERSGDGNRGLTWKIKQEKDWQLVRYIEGISTYLEVKERETTDEEKTENDRIADEAFDDFSKA